MLSKYHEIGDLDKRVIGHVLFSPRLGPSTSTSQSIRPGHSLQVQRLRDWALVELHQSKHQTPFQAQGACVVHPVNVEERVQMGGGRARRHNSFESLLFFESSGPHRGRTARSLTMVDRHWNIVIEFVSSLDIGMGCPKRHVGRSHETQYRTRFPSMGSAVENAKPLKSMSLVPCRCCGLTKSRVASYACRLLLGPGVGVLGAAAPGF
ncbi:hypothetical protein EDB82DRAFT_473800 [Fusarium venenatum]|uniref:uncharacterized protein n=1 Tax=Fusarium venenatum TaxID=56646 RepID=UPI001D443151|nr:hypothetical protein EDB82DRAFT_473800 [Fusarium venenatum]